MSELYINPNFYTTAPDSCGRLEKEMHTYKILDDLGIPYIRLDHDATATVESCLKVEEMLQIDICKNLFLCNAQKTQFYLFMLCGNKRFQSSTVARQVNSSRLSFADENDMEQLLNLTPGSVTVLGLIYDTTNQVQLLIDQDLLQQEYIGCHPCINTSSLKIKTKDLLETFLPFVNHKPIIIE